jgi:hypothetical protein
MPFITQLVTDEGLAKYLDTALIKNVAKRQENAPASTGKYICGNCFADAKLRCSRCHEVYYCSLGCQKEHWSSHKDTCGNTGSLVKDTILSLAHVEDIGSGRNTRKRKMKKKKRLGPKSNQAQGSGSVPAPLPTPSTTETVAVPEEEEEEELESTETDVKRLVTDTAVAIENIDREFSEASSIRSIVPHRHNGEEMSCVDMEAPDTDSYGQIKTQFEKLEETCGVTERKSDLDVEHGPTKLSTWITEVIEMLKTLASKVIPGSWFASSTWPAFAKCIEKVCSLVPSSVINIIGSIFGRVLTVAKVVTKFITAAFVWLMAKVRSMLHVIEQAVNWFTAGFSNVSQGMLDMIETFLDMILPNQSTESPTDPSIPPLDRVQEPHDVKGKKPDEGSTEDGSDGGTNKPTVNKLLTEKRQDGQVYYKVASESTSFLDDIGNPHRIGWLKDVVISDVAYPLMKGLGKVTMSVLMFNQMYVNNSYSSRYDIANSMKDGALSLLSNMASTLGVMVSLMPLESIHSIYKAMLAYIPSAKMLVEFFKDMYGYIYGLVQTILKWMIGLVKKVYAGAEIFMFRCVTCIIKRIGILDHLEHANQTSTTKELDTNDIVRELGKSILSDWSLFEHDATQNDRDVLNTLVTDVKVTSGTGVRGGSTASQITTPLSTSTSVTAVPTSTGDVGDSVQYMKAIESGADGIASSLLVLHVDSVNVQTQFGIHMFDLYKALVTALAPEEDDTTETGKRQAGLGITKHSMKILAQCNSILEKTVVVVGPETSSASKDRIQSGRKPKGRNLPVFTQKQIDDFDDSTHVPQYENISHIPNMNTSHLTSMDRRDAYAAKVTFTKTTTYCISMGTLLASFLLATVIFIVVAVPMIASNFRHHTEAVKIEFANKNIEGLTTGLGIELHHIKEPNADRGATMEAFNALYTKPGFPNLATHTQPEQKLYDYYSAAQLEVLASAQLMVFADAFNKYFVDEYNKNGTNKGQGVNTESNTLEVDGVAQVMITETMTSKAMGGIVATTLKNIPKEAPRNGVIQVSQTDYNEFMTDTVKTNIVNVAKNFDVGTVLMDKKRMANILHDVTTTCSHSGKWSALAAFTALQTNYGNSLSPPGTILQFELNKGKEYTARDVVAFIQSHKNMFENIFTGSTSNVITDLDLINQNADVRRHLGNQSSTPFDNEQFWKTLWPLAQLSRFKYVTYLWHVTKKIVLQLLLGVFTLTIAVCAICTEVLLRYFQIQLWRTRWECFKYAIIGIATLWKYAVLPLVIVCGIQLVPYGYLVTKQTSSAWGTWSSYMTSFAVLHMILNGTLAVFTQRPTQKHQRNIFTTFILGALSTYLSSLTHVAIPTTPIYNNLI